MSGQSSRFVLADSFSYLNKGDAGIILGMIRGLEEQFEDPVFTIISETPEIDEERYTGDITTYGSPFRQMYRVDSIAKKLALFGFTFVILCWGLLYRITGGRLLCPGQLAIVKEYTEADAVLISGGDKYYDYREGPKAAIEGVPKLFETILAIVVGTKLMIYAHSAGPFENRYRRPLLRWMLRRADVITAREPISEKYFKSLGVDVTLTADAAFLAPGGDKQAAVEELQQHGITPSEPIAGLTVREWHFPESQKTGEEYREGIVEAVGYLQQNGYQVVFFPQVIGPNTDDRVLSREIACNIDGAIVLNRDYDVPFLRELIGTCDLFVGTRMHSNIFALSKRVPTVAIAYRHKTDGIMQMFDMNENVVDIAETRADLLEVIEQTDAEREHYQEKLDETLPRIREQARTNQRLTRNLLNQGRTNAH